MDDPRGCSGHSDLNKEPSVEKHQGGVRLLDERLNDSAVWNKAERSGASDPSGAAQSDEDSRAKCCETKFFVCSKGPHVESHDVARSSSGTQVL